MMRMEPEPRRHHAFEAALDLEGRAAGRKR
jgi:hypothetical protein